MRERREGETTVVPSSAAAAETVHRFESRSTSVLSGHHLFRFRLVDSAFASIFFVRFHFRSVIGQFIRFEFRLMPSNSGRHQFESWLSFVLDSVQAHGSVQQDSCGSDSVLGSVNISQQQPARSTVGQLSGHRVRREARTNVAKI
ncbi:hypothetical protein Hanom_Chr15g01342331 [Helianthus anomalus]